MSGANDSNTAQFPVNALSSPPKSFETRAKTMPLLSSTFDIVFLHANMLLPVPLFDLFTCERILIAVYNTIHMAEKKKKRENWLI